MARKRYSTEQIIRMLREAEVELGKGKKLELVIKKLGITEQTYYRWRKRYGGVKTDHAKRLKELEEENRRLKQMYADLSLDHKVLKDIVEKKL